MKLLSNISFSHLVIFISTILLLWITANLNFGKENWKEIVRTDGKGYYAYLPAIFIYDDLNFGFYDAIENQKYYNPKTTYDYRSGANDQVISKYYCGTAIAQMPLFLVAHSYVKISGGDADGYSKPYMISVALSTLLFCLIGLIFLNKLLILYEVKDKWRALTILASVFGTNLFFYVVGEPSISHVYSFGLISMFLYFSKVYFNQGKRNLIPILGTLLGMIVLVRPINGLILFTWPFIAGDWSNFKLRIAESLKNYKALLIGLISFFTIVAIQLIYYKVATGSFIVYSYGEEGFKWTEPHMLDILFSYKKGLFLYTPIYLIALFGLYYFWKENRYLALSWMGVFLLITYVFSSWHMWWYGGSFSGRIYVEFIPFFMIALAIALNRMKSFGARITFVISIFLLIALCQIQTFQYRYYKIHWDSMTQEMYWKEFLRVDRIK